MKAYRGYRASNRNLKPTLDVIATAGPGAGNTVRLNLFTNDLTVFRVEMTSEEAQTLARALQVTAGHKF